MDPVLQAFTGLMMDNKGEDGIPHRVPFVVIDMSTALYAFQALSAALYARRDEPQGRRIEVSLLQAASAIQVIRMMMVYLEGEQVRRAMPSGVFKTADGWLQFLVVRDAQWVTFCTPCSARRSSRPIPASPTSDARMHNEAELLGHRAAGDCREAHRLLGGAPARGRHHARAAQQLPRLPAPAAGRGHRPRQLARRPPARPSRSPSPTSPASPPSPTAPRAPRRRVSASTPTDILASTASPPSDIAAADA